MIVSCPRCSAAIPSEDVNVARVIAKCRLCGAVFNFESQLALPASPPAQPIAPVALPPGIELAVDDQPSAGAAGPYRGGMAAAGELSLTRKWFDPQSIGLLVFGVAWCSFLVFWYQTAFSGGAPWIFFVFPIAHVAAGFVILHKALTGLFNRTTIRIANGRLTVRHGPIPAWGNRDIPVADLRQLYTVTKSPSKGPNTYEVHALPAVGPTVEIVSGLRDVRQAVFIERALEDHLRIEDDATANQRA